MVLNSLPSGYQIIVHVLGCKIGPIKNPRHGLTRNIFEKARSVLGEESHQVFKNINFPLKMAAYNSLGINSLSKDFYSLGWEILCECENNEIQGIAKLQAHLAPTIAFQFHPESFMSEQSDKLRQNLIDIYSANWL